MTRAMAFGTFSLIHPGHIHYLTEAKRLADELIVVVARDSTVRRVKGKCVVPEEQRRMVVEALKPVDEAILGDESDKYKVIEEYRPDVIVLGPDKEMEVERLKYELSKRGLNPKIVRVTRLDGKFFNSSKILEFLCKDLLSKQR